MFRIVYLLDSFFHARLKLTCISKTLCRQVSFYGFSTTPLVYIQAEKVSFGYLPIEAFRLHELLNDRTTQCNTRWIKETTFNKKQEIVLFYIQDQMYLHLLCCLISHMHAHRTRVPLIQSAHRLHLPVDHCRTVTNTVDKW